MASIAQIKTDVKKVLDADLAPATLEASAGVMFDNIFDITLGLFLNNQGTAVWKPTFRQFILVQTRKIAREAKKHAPNGVVSPTAFNHAARTVMRSTNKHCKARVKGGVVVGIPKVNGVLQPKAGELDGDVCSVYLSTQE